MVETSLPLSSSIRLIIGMNPFCLGFITDFPTSRPKKWALAVEATFSTPTCLHIFCNIKKSDKFPLYLGSRIDRTSVIKHMAVRAAIPVSLSDYCAKEFQYVTLQPESSSRTRLPHWLTHPTCLETRRLGTPVDCRSSEKPIRLGKPRYPTFVFASDY